MCVSQGLQENARGLMTHHTHESLQPTLPALSHTSPHSGVGPYTSAAVASIAFNDPAAAVDGNVIRVVSRLRALGGDPTRLTKWHAAIAQDMLDRTRPGCFNQVWGRQSVGG